MTRNLDARVEVVTPVEDPELADRIEGILSIALADDRFAWELEPDGGWCRIRDGAGVSGQVRLQSLARERATGTVKRKAAGADADLAFSQRLAGGGRRS